MEKETVSSTKDCSPDENLGMSKSQLEMYKTMLRVGIPEVALTQRMRSDGISVDMIQRFFACSAKTETTIFRKVPASNPVTPIPLAEHVQLWSAAVQNLRVKAKEATTVFHGTCERISDIMIKMAKENATVQAEREYWHDGEGLAGDLTVHALHRLRKRVVQVEAEFDDYLERPEPSIDYFLEDDDF